MGSFLSFLFLTGSERKGKYNKIYTDISTRKMSFASDDIISSLKGQVLKKNEHKQEYGEAKEWTPYNAEMNLTGIKVLVKNPMPEKVKRDGSFEDTMMLLEMIKEKQQKENKQMKEERIRAMAMEKKMKNQQTKEQFIKLTF